MKKDLLKNILDNEFLETLAKSADLYKIGSNSVLDPEEIRIGLKVVPRAVMSMLISELSEMEINSHKEIQLPFGKDAYLSASKNAADDYTGAVYDNNKMVYDFKNRSIPGLGIILLSTFELYDMDNLSAPQKDDSADKIQKLIDERMTLHSLVSKVVEDKMSQREALHKLIMGKLGEALKVEEKKNSDIAEIREINEKTTPQSDPYFRGMTNGLEVANSIANKKEPKFVEAPKKSQHLPSSTKKILPLDIKAADIIKKEPSVKKGSPLKDFIARKKSKSSKKYHVEMAKSETVNCPDCNQKIFGEGNFSACICYGENMGSKIWIKKSDDGFEFKFSRNWTADNVELLLETLRKRK